MKTLSLTAAFAFLFFSSAFAGNVKKQNPKAASTTAQKAPATATKPAVTKAPVATKPGTTSTTQAAKPTTHKPVTHVKTKAVAAPKKPAASVSKDNSREFHPNKFEMLKGKHHGKHHKGKGAARPTK